MNTPYVLSFSYARLRLVLSFVFTVFVAFVYTGLGQLFLSYPILLWLHFV